MFSLRDALKNRFNGNPHMKNILMASGVVFPDIVFHSDSQEIIPEIVYDRSTQDISAYMNQVFDYWKERQHREPSKLSPSDIREIVQFLRADFCFKYFAQTLPEKFYDYISQKLNDEAEAEEQQYNLLVMDEGWILKEIMKDLREGKVSAGDITFLSPKKYKNSKLAASKIAVNELKDDFLPDPNVPVYATIQGFKGLDAKVVILCDVEALRSENFSQYIYLAGTRAFFDHAGVFPADSEKWMTYFLIRRAFPVLPVPKR